MEEGLNLWLIGGGITIGLILGGIIQRSKFCMAAAVSNVVLMHDFRQLHAYLAAIAIAIVGSQLLDLFGVIELGASGYRSSNISWLGASMGGLVFGFGTMLAGGCIGRTIVRVGEGNLGALLALAAIAFAAAMTLYGFVEPLRLWLTQDPVYQLDATGRSVDALLGVPSYLVMIVTAALCLLGILVLGNNHRSPVLLAAGAGVGLLVVGGWVVTGYFSQDLFSLHRPASLTYAGPLANTTVLVTTGNVLGSGAQFGIALVFGTIAGASMAAALTHSFKWTLPDRGHIAHILIGGLLMGFGAILAGGCNIGQGISGLSTFSVQSLIALLATAFGMWAGVLWLLHTEMSEHPYPWSAFRLKQKSR